ncbi:MULTISPECIES: helix-turn-helix domain-containing protein [unclassified Sphingomonas]|uniref:helix-turn-helix domain-containing protein n=1 Tax=unclassified Sphingomonas TaxID=196159 RepID=UPI0006FF0421|nr:MULTISPECIES: XRE family transcriptional regulator [unclassified Sphingomonas]KQX26012.1 XRE family transcriptional regulator [Sphingomonas sp. Root1294]KQY69078.1 XRE family transcriptional regulator [Sphingomonas sp. Root50]KRB89332.1 XRE family transcriptional regulator [Sphingomonas sp. Root720]
MREGKTLGSLVVAIRRRHDWTLKQMSEVVGIPLSTLGKVESDKLSLSYDKIQKVAQRLGMSMADFFSQSDEAERSAKPVTARRSLMDAGNSVRIETQNYRYDYLCSDLTRKRMVPIISEIKARTLEQFGEQVSHPGEEFIYVLEGAIQVHLEFYAPTVIRQGKGIYIDSQMRHAYVLHECDRAVVLAVCAGDDPDLEKTLVGLAEADRASI